MFDSFFLFCRSFVSLSLLLFFSVVCFISVRACAFTSTAVMHGTSLAVLKGTPFTYVIFFPPLILFLSWVGCFDMFLLFLLSLCCTTCAVLGWFFVPHFLSSRFLLTSLSTELWRAIVFYVCSAALYLYTCKLFFSSSRPSHRAACKRAGTRLRPCWLLAGCVVLASVCCAACFTFSGFGFGLASRSAKPQVA